MDDIQYWGIIMTILATAKIGVKEQYEKYRCSKCGGLISIHNRKCFKCDKIIRLVEKYNRKY